MKGRRMIESVLKFPNGIVIAFDDGGLPIPEYQGFYEDVKDNILANASDSVKFIHAQIKTVLETVSRDTW
jgi:hypothetical protein